MLYPNEISFIESDAKAPINSALFKKALIVVVAIFTLSQSRTVEQEFNSQSEFDSFWDVSTWGNSALQYSSDNVWLENGNLVLKLNASTQGTKPVCGEIASKETDYFYGSYRASIKFMNIPGSVIGWFVYKDGVPGDGNLHEIDVEYLTEDLSKIYFTLHHDEYSVDHQIKPISFDPTADFHEYRFDWYPDSVSYYIDSIHVGTLTNKVPDAACAIMLNHWSKNITDWGGPAPTKDTYMYVDYMHYYSDYGQTNIKSSANVSIKKQVNTLITGNALRVNMKSNSEVINTISIYTLLGKEILSHKNIKSSTATLDISKLPTGLFFTRINSSAGIFVKKINIIRQ